jgi:cell division septation protein DedD
MDRQGWKTNRNTRPSLGFLLLLALLLFSAVPGYAGTNGSSDLNYQPAGKYYYYPDHNFSPYNYQSTGDFANQPMVIPPSVPVMRQPAYYYMDGPKARQVINNPSYYPQPAPYYGMAPQQYAPRQAQQYAPRQAQQYAPRQAQQYAPQQSQQQMSPQNHPALLPQNQQAMAPNHPAMNNPARTYSLHVGSFLVYSKADELDRKIKELGLKSYRKEMAAEGIHYMQLRVGPFQSKQEMKQAAALLDSKKIKNRIAIR